MLAFYCVALCLISIGLKNVIAETVDVSFRNHGLVPDIMKTPPRNQLYARYPSGDDMNFGNELTPAVTSEAPTAQWEDDSDSLYTLIMIDPDAPSRKNPVRRNWLHWLVGNIPGKAVNKGTVLAAYNGPAPPKDTGAHRYVLLVYKQREILSFSEKFPAEEKGRRGNFNLERFTAKYHLGNPIAGNFFQAKPQQH